MSSGFRRYEILLPLRFNEGTLVPDEIVGQTLLDLRQRFGAVSSEPQTISGHWEQGGQVHLDDLIRVFVDVADEAGNREFFRQFKESSRDPFVFAVFQTTAGPV
jgi:hypothetical protein